MTTADAFTKPPRAKAPFRLPDPPPREPDEVTSFHHLSKNGSYYNLTQHFGNLETTLVEADLWMVPDAEFDKRRARRPDLLIAFNVSLQTYRANNGYVISEQGKPPDFVMEVASPSTADTDTGAKRQDYAAMGITEYWRFDETGEHHGARLAGERLVDGAYQPFSIEEIAPDVFQGYSPAIDLYIRWERGLLVWIDPATNRRIVTMEDEREARIREAAAYLRERAARIREREARLEAEARVQELEAELRRLRD